MHMLKLKEWGSIRDEAREVFAEQQVPDRLDGQCFVLLCNRVRHVSDVFMDEIVSLALARGVAEIALVGAPKELVEHAEEAAWRRGVPDVVAVRRAVEVGA